jgi:hypothetical protein
LLNPDNSHRFRARGVSGEKAQDPVESRTGSALKGAQNLAPRRNHLHLQLRTWVYLGVRTEWPLGQWSSLTTSRLNEVLEVVTVPRGSLYNNREKNYGSVRFVEPVDFSVSAVRIQLGAQWVC